MLHIDMPPHLFDICSFALELQLRPSGTMLCVELGGLRVARELVDTFIWPVSPHYRVIKTLQGLNRSLWAITD